MIERVQITSFQSLKSVDLRFGRYTVIVGPSSSGKTALMRAIRAVASNVRGTHVITRGQTRMAVTVHTGDAKVTLERDQAAGKYRVAAGHTDETFTKLAGGVPAAVTEALRIDPVPTNGTSVNFASQFDPPYLLGESGANVARTLGSLTNVTTILEAAREANRRRNAAASELRTREADLARLKQEGVAYQNLPQQLAALSAAETAAGHAEALQGRIAACRALLSDLEAAERVLGSSVPAPLPDVRAVTDAHERWNAGRDLIRSWALAERAAQQTGEVLRGTSQVLTQLEAELERVHARTGTCPTCKQPVTARNFL